MPKVKALIDGVKDNGVLHAKDDEFEMAEALIGPHVKAGQVEVLPERNTEPVKSPADRQQKPRKTK